MAVLVTVFCSKIDSKMFTKHRPKEKEERNDRIETDHDSKWHAVVILCIHIYHLLSCERCICILPYLVGLPIDDQSAISVGQTLQLIDNVVSATSPSKVGLYDHSALVVFRCNGLKLEGLNRNHGDMNSTVQVYLISVQILQSRAAAIDILKP